MNLDLPGLAAARAVVLVEGMSDQAALEAEEGHFRRALERAGLGSRLSRAGLEALGFYVCTDDLEDELIRALRVASVERVIEAQGEIRSFRVFQKQPAQRRIRRHKTITGSNAFI